MRSNYQLANRLTFLEKMKEISAKAKAYDQVKLVLLNFVNDPTWDEQERVKDPYKWTNHYEDIFRNMGITRKQVEEQGVVEINYSSPYIY